MVLYTNKLVAFVKEYFSFLSFRNTPNVVWQEEINDCGLCCLSMLLKHYGANVSIMEIKQESNYNNEVLSLNDISRIANSYDLSASGFGLDSVSDLHTISMPCILHWNSNHYVVLHEIKNDSLVISDPARGYRTVKISSSLNAFTGIVLELKPTKNFSTTKSASLSLLKLIPNYSVHLKTYILFVVLALLSQSITLVSPLLSQLVIDKVFIPRNSALLDTIFLGFFTIMFAELFFNYVKAKFGAKLVSNLSHDFCQRLIEKKFLLPFKYFEGRSVGDILSRFESGGVISRTLANEILNILIDSLIVIVSLIAMLLYNAKLTFFVLILCSFYLLYRIHTFPQTEAITKDQIKRKGDFDSFFFETMSEFKSIKLFSKEDTRTSKFLSLFVDRLNSDLRMKSVQAEIGVVSLALFGAASVSVFYLSAIQIMQGEISVGMFIAFLAYQSKFLMSFNSFLDNFSNVRNMLVHKQRIADFLTVRTDFGNSLPQVADVHMLASGFELSIDGLSYTYARGRRFVFEDINFSMRKGSVVAVTGPSGCGKSTLLDCLSSLIKPSAGAIRLNGVDISVLSNYIKLVACVGQSERLLNGSIRDNIAFFDSHVDQERVSLCARIACIDEDVRQMDLGYDTSIYGTGINLSGGQIQRLLIARALYKRPLILFLDEGTSQIDPSTEAKIFENFRRIGLTVLVVAHRNETVLIADEVICFPLKEEK